MLPEKLIPTRLVLPSDRSRIRAAPSALPALLLLRREGAWVAVKVLRPHVEETADRDWALLRRLTGWLQFLRVYPKMRWFDLWREVAEVGVCPRRLWRQAGSFMATRNLIGKRGEAIVTARLMDFRGNPAPYFDVHPLGEKCPTFDHLVELVSAGTSVPYFLAQVKSTRKGFTQTERRLLVQVDEEDVRRMVRCPFPTYLIGVDEPNDRAYVVSVHGNISGSIASMPSRYPLTPRNLRKLWQEVAAYWKKLDAAAKVSTFLYED